MEVGAPSWPTESDNAGRRLAFRRTVRAFPTGVTVVTTLTPTGPWGMTVNAFTSVSLDPLLVLVSLSRDSRLSRAVADSGTFAVTLLSHSQQEVAERFADRSRAVGVASFGGLSVTPAPVTGCPVLPDGVCWFDCRVYDRHDAGDHVLVVGAVVEFGQFSAQPPLVFADSAYSSLHHVPAI